MPKLQLFLGNVSSNKLSWGTETAEDFFFKVDKLIKKYIFTLFFYFMKKKKQQQQPSTQR